MNNCPKCNAPLKGKAANRYCINGCEIYTAIPPSGCYPATSMSRLVDGMGSIQSSGTVTPKRKASK